MKKKTKIVFFCGNVTLAHIARPLTLAKSLDKDKYEIIFVVSENYKKYIEDANFEYITIWSMSNKEFMKRLYWGKALFYDKLIDKYLKDEFEILDKIKPDIVIGDFRLTLGISCKVRKIPYILITNSHWSIYSKTKYDICPDSIIGTLFGDKIAKIMFKNFLPLFMWFNTKPYKKYCKKYKLEEPKGINGLYSYADYILYEDIPSRNKLETLPSNHLFLGPVLWEPNVKLPKELNNKYKDKILIYFTLGSSGAFSKKIIKALDNDKYVVFMATAGKNIDLKYPNNFLVFDYLPGIQALKKVDLVINNGGVGCVHQALSEGVPMLCIPSNMDQYLTAKSVYANGWGIYFSKQELNIKNIRNALDELKNEKYKNSIAIAQSEIKKYVSGNIFRDFIESIIEQKK